MLADKYQLDCLKSRIMNGFKGLYFPCLMEFASEVEDSIPDSDQIFWKSLNEQLKAELRDFDGDGEEIVAALGIPEGTVAARVIQCMSDTLGDFRLYLKHIETCPQRRPIPGSACQDCRRVCNKLTPKFIDARTNRRRK